MLRRIDYAAYVRVHRGWLHGYGYGQCHGSGRQHHGTENGDRHV
jgi:hypothetical protein